MANTSTPGASSGSSRSGASPTCATALRRCSTGHRRVRLSPRRECLWGRNFPDTSPFLSPSLLERLDKDFLSLGQTFKQDVAKLARDRPIQAFLLAGRAYPAYPAQAEILSGLIDAGQTIDREFVAAILNSVETHRPAIGTAMVEMEPKPAIQFARTPGVSEIRETVDDRILREQSGSAIALAAANLYATGYAAEADRLLDAPFTVGERKLRYCPDEADHIRRAAALGSLEGVSAKLAALCRRRTISDDYLLQAARAAHQAGHLDVAGARFSTGCATRRNSNIPTTCGRPSCFNSIATS